MATLNRQPPLDIFINQITGLRSFMDRGWVACYDGLELHNLSLIDKTRLTLHLPGAQVASIYQLDECSYEELEDILSRFSLNRQLSLTRPA